MTAGPTSDFKVALIQAPPVFLNLAATVDRVEALIPQAASEGARVAVFPETWLPGYPVWIDAAPGAALWNDPGAKALYRLLVQNSVQLGDAWLERIGAAADAHGVVVVIGGHERVGGSLFNTMFTFDGAGQMNLHRKLTPTYTERLLWGAGDGSTLRAMDTGVGVVGGLICWEHWMPLARAAMHAQHELLHVAQWPWVREIHRICSRQYAFEAQCYVAASGCEMTRGDVLEGFDSLAADEPEAREILASMSGDDDTLMLRGGSCLIAPDAEVQMEAAAGTSMVLAEVVPDRVVEGRMYLDTDGHYSRPDVFTLTVDTRTKLNVERPEDE